MFAIQIKDPQYGWMYIIQGGKPILFENQSQANMFADNRRVSEDPKAKSDMRVVPYNK